MRLERLTPELLQRVTAIYFEHAYPGHTRRLADLGIPAEGSPRELLACFTDETPAREQGAVRRYIMRLGNVNYPFMKLVFQEHLFPGEFCFVVDTHDDIEVPRNAPDFDAWLKLKELNRRLKRRIEEAWEAEGIPTQRLLQNLASGRKQGKAEGRGEEILVADDEEEVARAMVGLLQAEGFRARAVFDGRRALEEVKRRPPDLLVLDYEMPELSGIEVIELLQEKEKTAGLPVLLMTGGPITLSEKHQANGFLCKPFSEDVLLDLVHHLLGR
mgnify:CR=1 FL=1|jgi:CheY-like chemotaxis protein